MFALNQVAHAWWAWMSSMFWQVSLLVLIVSLIDMLIRKWMWPQVRYAMWLLIFIKLVIPPGWSLQTGIVTGIAPSTREYIASRWDSTFPSPDNKAASGRMASDRPAGAGEAAPVLQHAGETAVDDAGERRERLSMQSLLMAIWLAGIVLYSILLAARIRKLKRWHREQIERKTIPQWFHEILVRTGRQLGIEELPAIVFSEEAVTPAVYGIFRPVLLLPANYIEELSEDEAEHILIHELGHLKRGDLWVHGSMMVLQIVYWFNPLLLWASRQIKHMREICCDLTIAGYLREKTEAYRRTLLNTARELLTETVEPGMGLLGVFEEPFWLVARIRWLEKRTWERRRPVAAGVIVLLLIMVPFVLPMAAGGPGEFSMPPAAGGETDLREDTTDEYRDYDSSGQTAWLVADVTREYTYFLWARTATSVYDMGEVWYGGDKVELNQNNRTYILDRGRNLFTVINHDDETYVRSSLPISESELLSKELNYLFQDLQYDGKVKKTKHVREHLGKECTRYDITTWELRGDTKGERSSIRVWTTLDVPFDVGLMHELMHNVRKLTPRTRNLKVEMDNLIGVQMIVDMSFRDFLWRKRYLSKVVEIVRKVPPEGTFEVPDWYDRKDQLEPGDMR